MFYFISRSFINLYKTVENRELETQLVYGEKVRIWERNGDFCRIEAVEQPYFDGRQWSGYPGWIKTCALTEKEIKGHALRQLWHGGYPMGAIVEKMDADASLVELASLYLGMPYLWGGRIPFHPDFALSSSVDCSGLIHQIYRVLGKQVPRNAHDQYLVSKEIAKDELLPGDLLFHNEEGERMTHVMLYAGEGEMIESCQNAGGVRRIPIREKFTGKEKIAYCRLT